MLNTFFLPPNLYFSHTRCHAIHILPTLLLFRSVAFTLLEKQRDLTKHASVVGPLCVLEGALGKWTPGQVWWQQVMSSKWRKAEFYEIKFLVRWLIMKDKLQILTHPLKNILYFWRRKHSVVQMAQSPWQYNDAKDLRCHWDWGKQKCNLKLFSPRSICY